MEQQKGVIGIREYIAIIILTLGTKLTDDTPAILYNRLQNAAWMGIIISGILAIIPIYLLIKVLTLYPKKSLLDVINHLFGKYIGYLVILILWLIGSYAIIIDSAIYTDIIGTLYYISTPTIIIYLILMGVCAYGAKKGLEQIGSFAWAVLPYVKVSLFLVMVLTLKDGNLSFIFPIFGPGEWAVVKESSLKLSIYADLFYFALLVPYIKNAKDFRKGTWIAFGILIVELTIALAAYVILFDYVSVKFLNYPFHEAIRYIQFGFLDNIETFFLPFWLIATCLRFSVYLYLNGILFGKLFKIKEFEYVIPSLATLFLFIGMIPETPTFTIFYFRKHLLHLTTPVFFFMPIALWLMAKLKGDFKNEKATTGK